MLRSLVSTDSLNCQGISAAAPFDMIRLLRLLKVVKNKNKLSLYLNELLRLGASFENLFISVLGIILFCHIAACTWYMISDLNVSGGDPTFWTARLNFQDSGPIDVRPIHLVGFISIAICRCLLLGGSDSRDRWIWRHWHR